MSDKFGQEYPQTLIKINVFYVFLLKILTKINENLFDQI